MTPLRPLARTLRLTLAALLATIVIAVAGAVAYFGAELLPAIDAVAPLLIEQPTTTDSVTLIVVGDTGSQDKQSAAVAKALERYCESTPAIAGIVLLGDNFYPSGVKSVDDPQWQRAVWRPFSKPCLSTLPLYPILGNHDRKGDAHVQVAYTAVNPAGICLAVSTASSLAIFYTSARLIPRVLTATHNFLAAISIT